MNANELQVTFNTPVDKKSATALSAYVITVNNDKYGQVADGHTDINTLLNAAPNNIVINKEGTVVTFKLDDATNKVLKHGDKYGIDVKDSILTADGKTNIERYGDTQKVFSDLAAPKLVDTKLVGQKLHLSFDEPLKMNPADFKITIDGIEVVGADLTAPVSPLDYTYVVTLDPTNYPNALDKGKHDVTIFNARDHVQNNASSGNHVSIISTSYDANQEQSQPKVEAVLANDFNSFDVEFNKQVAAGARIIVKKGNTVFYDKQTTAATLIETIELPITATSPSGGLTWLYDNTATSTDVTIEVVDYKDVDASLYGDTYKGTLKLNRDAAKPTGLTGQLEAAGAGLEIQLNRKDDLTATPAEVKVKGADATTPTAASIDTNKVKVTDKNGIVRTVDSAEVDHEGKVTVTLNGVGGAGPTYASLAPFKVEVAAGAVAYETDRVKVESPKDNAGIDFAIGDFTNELKNDAFTVSIATTDSAYKAIENVDTVSISDKNVITVTYKNEVNATATNAANYSIDGRPMPAGTTVSLDGTGKIVTLVLPEETYSTNQKRAVGISTDVLTVKGEHVVGNLAAKTPYLSQLEDIHDNVKPVLASAKFVSVANDNTTDEIELTFSENVEITGNNTNFVVIAHDGTELPAAVATVATPGAKKVVLTLEGGKKVNVAQTIKVKVAAETAANSIQVTDKSTRDGGGNKLTEGTVVTVAK